MNELRVVEATSLTEYRHLRMTTDELYELEELRLLMHLITLCFLVYVFLDAWKGTVNYLVTQISHLNLISTFTEFHSFA